MNKQLKTKELERCKRVIESYDADITELSAEVTKVKEKYLALAEKETADINEVIEYYKEQKNSWTEKMKKLKALKDFTSAMKSVQEETEEKEETVFDPYETEEEDSVLNEETSAEETAETNDDFPEEEPVEHENEVAEDAPVNESDDWPEDMEDKGDGSAAEESSSDDEWPDAPEEW